MDTDAAFIVRTLDGHEYRIYADGRTEGFSEPHVIFNRIPALVTRAYLDATSQNEAA